MATILNPSMLGTDNVPGNDYAFSIDMTGNHPYIIRNGAMIAYYGQIQLTSLHRGMSGQMMHMISSTFSAPLYMGEYTLAEGAGMLIIGDRGYHINSYDLDNGNLTVRAANLLGFDPGLKVNQSIVPGFLTLIGTGKFLASSNGQVIFVEPPVRVDPEALIGWADCPSPSHHYDQGWVSNFMAAGAARFGVSSGEERQFDFTGAGTVLVQSSEKVINDWATVRMIEGQIQGLSAGGLQRIMGVIQSKLGENR